MTFRFDVCKITTCVISSKMLSAADALIVPLNCTSTTHMFCTFDLKSKKYIMHCPNLCLTSSLSHFLFIVFDPVTNVPWIHVLSEKGEHNGIWKKILCHSCQADIHHNCSRLLLDDFESALSDGNWICRLGVEGFFPYSHFYDDNDFMKCFEELSLSSDISARLLNNAKVFNPFDINEDKDDIIEYHGNIDPDKCYFN